MTESGLWVLIAIAGLTVVSVVTRSFFFMSEREWPMPRWVQHGLQYAPVAALAAVTVPDIFMATGSSLSVAWLAPRVLGALAGALYYFWRRRSSMALPLAIIAGLAVYLPLQWLATI